MTTVFPLALGIPGRVGDRCIVPVVRTVTWTSGSGCGGHVEVAGLFILEGEDLYTILLSDAVTVPDLLQAMTQ